MITFGRADIRTGMIAWKLDGQWIMDTPHSVWQCEDENGVYYVIKCRGEYIGRYGTLLEVANDLAAIETNRLRKGR